MRFYLRIILALAIFAASPPLFADSSMMTWTVDGVKRQAIVFSMVHADAKGGSLSPNIFLDCGTKRIAK